MKKEMYLTIEKYMSSCMNDGDNVYKEVNSIHETGLSLLQNLLEIK